MVIYTFDLFRVILNNGTIKLYYVNLPKHHSADYVGFFANIKLFNVVLSVSYNKVYKVYNMIIIL
jgi:hypothetical protein